MKRILLTTDFSELATASYPIAARMAERFDADVTLIHVIDSLVYNANYPYPDFAQHRAEIEHMVREGLARGAARLEELGAPRVRTIYRLGAPYKEILTELEVEGDYSLLVASTHGASGLRRAVVGSVTELLIRMAPCPVLAVHAGDSNEGFAIRRILVATDFSDSSHDALQAAARLAKAHDAKIELFHSFNAPSPYIFAGPGTIPAQLTPNVELTRQGFLEALDKERQRADAGVPIEVRLVEHYNPSEAIAERAKTGDFDLVVVGSHGRRGFRRLMVGSVAERTVRHSEAPVLIVKGDIGTFAV
jgi:nucleotide-binding universal stress UspA family protein